MLETVEEFAGRHIDGLYHDALFLHAGDEPLAEDLVLWTLTGAFQAFRHFEGRSPPEHWLEGKLIEVFLARTASGSTDDGSTDAFSGDDLSTDNMSAGDVSADDIRRDVMSSHEHSSGAVEIDPEALLQAAANMPPLARAAIWLVVFRRWSYRDASSVLKTDLHGLKDLLRYRQILITAVVWGSVDRNGTDHDRRH